jgi:hypothetical protein
MHATGHRLQVDQGQSTLQVCSACVAAVLGGSCLVRSVPWAPQAAWCLVCCGLVTTPFMHTPTTVRVVALQCLSVCGVWPPPFPASLRFCCLCCHSAGSCWEACHQAPPARPCREAALIQAPCVVGQGCTNTFQVQGVP